MLSSSTLDKNGITDRIVDLAKSIPFAYFVIGGTAFAVAVAFTLFALQSYILLGNILSGWTIFIGITTPLVTASICFYFAALIIQKLKKAESALEMHNLKLQEQVATEVEKRRQKERLLVQQSKMALMGEMMGAVAHQWRQPLNALGIIIQDTAYAYKHGLVNDEYVNDLIDNSMRQIRMMSKTIDDFRNFFSPDIEKREFCIEDSINETLHIVDAGLLNTEISVIFNKEEEHSVVGYKSEFQQVVLNLLSNSKDAIVQSNQPDRHIFLYVSRDNDSLYIAIEDTGGGISDEIRERIFEPYFTTKEQGSGTGIGLYMSKQIIERHMGGTLTVENTEKGARFTIKLPVR